MSNILSSFLTSRKGSLPYLFLSELSTAFIIMLDTGPSNICQLVSSLAMCLMFFIFSRTQNIHIGSKTKYHYSVFYLKTEDVQLILVYYFLLSFSLPSVKVEGRRVFNLQGVQYFLGTGALVITDGLPHCHQVIINLKCSISHRISKYKHFNVS